MTVYIPRVRFGGRRSQHLNGVSRWHTSILPIFDGEHTSVSEAVANGILDQGNVHEGRYWEDSVLGHFNRHHSDE